MKTMPLVSILIPNYNYERYLGRCLKSAISQTYENIEIILSDNCSTDNSWEIAEEYANASQKLKIFRQKENIGLTANTFFLFDQSAGEYIISLPSDDAIEPTFIDKCVKIMELNKNVGFVMTSRIEVDGDDNVLWNVPFYNKSFIVSGWKQAAVFMLSGIGTTSQTLFRKHIAKEFSTSDPLFSIARDWSLFFRICCDYDFAYIKEPLAVIRLHSGSYSGTATRNFQQLFEHYQLTHLFLKIAEERGMTSVIERYPKAVKKHAEMCLRFCLQVLNQNDYEFAKKYLVLATVFDEDIVNNEKYKQLLYCLSLQGEDFVACLEKINQDISNSKRTVSYDPPDGYVEINLW